MSLSLFNVVPKKQGVIYDGTNGQEIADWLSCTIVSETGGVLTIHWLIEPPYNTYRTVVIAEGSYVVGEYTGYYDNFGWFPSYSVTPEEFEQYYFTIPIA